MELRQYWNLIRRRLWILVLLTLAALVVSLLVQLMPSGEYEMETRLKFELPPQLIQQQANTQNTYEVTGAAQLVTLTELFLDDLHNTLDTPIFLRSVYAKLEGKPLNEEMRPDFTAKFKKAHQVLIIQVKANDPEYARRVSNEMISQITGAGGLAEKLRSQKPTFEVVQAPALSNRPSLTQNLLNLVLRTLLGAFAGLAIIFLLTYLDNRMYYSSDVQEQLGLPVLGEIPAEAEVAKRLKKASQGESARSFVPVSRPDTERAGEVSRSR